MWVSVQRTTSPDTGPGFANGRLGFGAKTRGDPAGSAMVVVDSLARNVAAEGWFYGQVLAAMALGLAIDLIRKRDLRRYWTRSVRLDLVYGVLEFLRLRLRD